MTWFISSADILFGIVIAGALLLIAIGRTAMFIIERSGIRSNRAHGLILLAVAATYLGLAGSATYWVLT